MTITRTVSPARNRRRTATPTARWVLACLAHATISGLVSAQPPGVPMQSWQPPQGVVQAHPGMPQGAMMQPGMPGVYPGQGAYPAGAMMPVITTGAWSPQFGQPDPGVMQLPLPGANGVHVSSGMIQPVQGSAESARALHRLIDKMPTENDELEVIERRSQLMYTRANVTRIHIVDPSVVDVVQYGPRELAFLGLARGQTNLMMWFEGEADPIIYLVKTIRDPNLNNQRRLDYGKLERQINALFPNSKVYLIPLSWKILVRGQARDQQEANLILQVIQGEILRDGFLLGGGQGGVTAGGYAGFGGGFGDFGGVTGSGFNSIYGGFGGGGFFGQQSSFIVNQLTVPGEFQISLRVRIAELNRSQARSLGVDFDVLFNDASQQIFTNLGAAGAATLGGIFDDGNVTAVVRALASSGTAKILTEPNVVVISGQQARFLAGGEFAVPTTVGIGGAAAATTSFRGFGTSLLVTPEVMDRDLIRINAIAEYSDINNGNAVQGIPGTDSRRVQTTVEMREGQTLALAGLLSHRQVTEVTRIPFLGDIPTIGPLLFSSKQSTMEENELLILITPEIVRPMDPHEVPPVPGFEVTHPQDTELYKYNLTEGSPDTGYYQLPPYGSGAVGTNVGYQHFNPGPANSMYSPQPTNPNGQGFSSPTPLPNGGFPSGPGSAVPPDALPPQPADERPGYRPSNLQPVPGSSAQRGPNGNGFSRAAGSSQTIQPVNFSGPRGASAGSAGRGQR